MRGRQALSAPLQMAALSMQGRRDLSGFIQAFSGSVSSRTEAALQARKLGLVRED
jgi:hypothetical protein